MLNEYVKTFYTDSTAEIWKTVLTHADCHGYALSIVIALLST